MKAIIGILIFAAACGAQQPWVQPTFVQNAQTQAQSPPVLKCGKYQHVDHWPGQCGPSHCDLSSQVCTAECSSPPPDKCVDDMHPVTKREWQELMAKLKRLESIVETKEQTSDR
jgi:hypothetical protein